VNPCRDLTPANTSGSAMPVPSWEPVCARFLMLCPAFPLDRAVSRPDWLNLLHCYCLGSRGTVTKTLNQKKTAARSGGLRGL
jgi:hypothetical protein